MPCGKKKHGSGNLGRRNGRLILLYPIFPHQILSMIEEAAGTRMYESKKLSAQRTIEKKDSKLQEIETVRK